MYAYVGPGLARDFKAAHQGFSLVIDEGSDEYVSSLLTSGLAEVAFLASPVDPDLFETRPFSSHPHVLVVGLDDPLACKESVTLADLNGRRVATMCGGYSPNRGIRSRLAALGVVPSDYVGYAESYTGFLMAASGEAVCVNTDYAAALNLRPDVRVLPFSDPSFVWGDLHRVAQGRDLGAGGPRLRGLLVLVDSAQPGQAVRGFGVRAALRGTHGAP